ncbi:MAG: winged helix-turn-helix domain-containing protein [Candidatus Woesearchaeota archaeon]
MIARKNKITIYKSKKPTENNLNEDLQWVCDSLGLFGERDKDKSCFRMFVVLLKAIPTSEGLTSDEISEKVGLSRGTVVHHLHKLIGSGLVVYDGKKYMLRVNKLSSLIDELEHDILRVMDDLKDAAKKIDERLNL